MYITINNIKDEERIDLTYSIQNFDSDKEIAVIRMLSDNVKGVRAHKIPHFSFLIEERSVLGEYVEVAVTRNVQFYVSTAIHHSGSIFRKERKVICICGHQR